ncbi:MAG TPA: hypothetical protein VK198_11715, partial [Terriglobales bacterium]|nr:hypothetical protein [Terriglobales bacterium]
SAGEVTKTSQIVEEIWLCHLFLCHASHTRIALANASTDGKPGLTTYERSGFGNARLLGSIPFIREPSGRARHWLTQSSAGAILLAPGIVRG